MLGPVIGPDITGVPEILLDGVDGFIVEPDDVGMPVDRIKILLTDELQRQKFIENGYKKAFEQFNVYTESGSCWPYGMVRYGPDVTPAKIVRYA
jgi:hypothetical protein